ncbi:MAG: MerR family transcriptional regulator [Actinobacteria bacterium]|nr:MerR family transcriptional regulator [Actinomycetota bacterium]
MNSSGPLRIGELARRAGVSPELLRAWERRYELVRPERSPGGLRLYSAGDLQRVQAMRRHLASGMAAAEAADLAKREPRSGTPTGLDPAALQAQIPEAAAALDEPGLQGVLDTAIGALTVDTLLDAVVLPALREIGLGWQRGEMTVAQEHFATSVIRGRLLALARDWGRGLGPVAVLACMPRERHDLGLLAFGLALHSRGWRIVYLGSDTPLDSVDQLCGRLTPQLIALSSVDPELVESAAPRIRKLARGQRVVAGGTGFESSPAKSVRPATIAGGAVDTAEELTQSMIPGRSRLAPDAPP